MAGNFPQNFLDELRNRTSIAELIGRSVKLTRKGREFSGLCPFHSEKTPSFTVSEEKQFYHCFGCGAHGDAIKFLMQSQNLSFVDAVTQLAERAGLEVPKTQGRAEDPAELEKRKRLLTLTAQAQMWFTQNLNHSQLGQGARDYLAKRGLSPQTIAQFGIGFVPDDRDGLWRAMSKSGIDVNLAAETGLVIKAESREPYDRFRSRIMFPIHNLKKEPIAFGGRIFGEGEPKYLNSPETELFHKGRTVYALPFATPAMGKTRTAIVVEGYMDTIALHQAGITNAVATLGTALTESHVELLWRYADRILLCFDGDAAGLRAAERSIERILPLLRVGKEVRFVTIPAGFDPDTYVQAKGQKAFMDLCAAAAPFHEKLAQVEYHAKPVDSPESERDLYKRLAQKLSLVRDENLRQDYRRYIYDQLKPLLASNSSAPVSGFVKAKKIIKGAFARNPIPVPHNIHQLRKNSDVERRESEALLAALLLYPKLLAVHCEDLGTLSFADHDLEKLRMRLIDISHHADIGEWTDCFHQFDSAERDQVEDICERSRHMFRWLQEDNQYLIEHWRQSLLAHRTKQDQAPMHAPPEGEFDEASWEKYSRQLQQDLEAQQDLQNALLGAGNK
ncbi:MAG: DNA primase [Alphaproteobacteria bacterium]|nr:MAG: DNA primase [Alphaproteobacteria bacterium]